MNWWSRTIRSYYYYYWCTKAPAKGCIWCIGIIINPWKHDFSFVLINKIVGFVSNIIENVWRASHEHQHDIFKLQICNNRMCFSIETIFKYITMKAVVMKFVSNEICGRSNNINIAIVPTSIMVIRVAMPTRSMIMTIKTTITSLIFLLSINFRIKLVSNLLYPF